MTDVELIKPHTHVGKSLAPGARIALDDELARWLVEAGVARAVPAAPTKAGNPSTPKPEEPSQ